MLIPTMMISIQQNRVSTDLEDIVLLILLPMYPPITPEIIIVVRAKMSIWGTEEDAKENIRLAVWAKKII